MAGEAGEAEGERLPGQIASGQEADILCSNAEFCAPELD